MHFVNACFSTFSNVICVLHKDSGVTMLIDSNMYGEPCRRGLLTVPECKWCVCSGLELRVELRESSGSIVTPLARNRKSNIYHTHVWCATTCRLRPARFRKLGHAWSSLLVCLWPTVGSALLVYAHARVHGLKQHTHLAGLSLDSTRRHTEPPSPYLRL